MPKRPTSEFLRAVAAFRRYAHPVRTEVWEERFAFGLADVEQVFEAQVVGDPALSPPRPPQYLGFEPGTYEPASMSSDLFFAGAVQIAHQVRQRALSPVEDRHLVSRPHRCEPASECFITVNRDLVLREAEWLSQRVQRGEDPGPLAGVRSP